MMKQFIGAAVLAMLAVVTMAIPSSSCLYCHKEDKDSGFLTSFSYCSHQDTCLQDEWNYIRRDCQSLWQRGQDYPLETCEPEEIECPGFVSNSTWYQRYKNTTWAMAEGSKCKVSVDATDGIARVIFSSSSYLGIEFSA